MKISGGRKIYIVGTALSAAAVGVAALVFVYFDVGENAEIKAISKTSAVSNLKQEDDFLAKGGDPLAQVTDKFYAHNAHSNSAQRKELIAAVGLAKDGATAEEIKTVEKFPLEMISTGENLFEDQLSVYLKDGKKWSHWTSKGAK